MDKKFFFHKLGSFDMGLDSFFIYFFLFHSKIIIQSEFTAVEKKNFHYYPIIGSTRNDGHYYIRTKAEQNKTKKKKF
ncbi:hypothetical protein BpHYR1_014846 [Brachionus plicatilis]|uniref:Uncharacterized protein n=1 Tax=Brachionus plicatilis TaxID=10195 RepID=A0A3M7PTL9_BRAPC|nr:hypothetical protein BpHYR1_014846 [Brachionus plicatilis]